MSYAAESDRSTNASNNPEVNPRRAGPEKHSRYRAALRDGTDSCDDYGGGIMGADYASENLDILARARQALTVKAALNLPPPRDGLVSRFALEALVLNDRLGNFSGGDAYAKLISENGDYSGLETQYGKIHELEATGRTKEANLLRSMLSQDALLLLERTPGLDANKEQPTQEMKQTNRDLTVHCLQAIRNKDKPTAQNDVEKLLQLYESEAPAPEWRPPRELSRQNLFCTILDLARKFSDCGWYAESDTTLDKLYSESTEKHDWDTANGFILVERAINAARRNCKSEQSWRRLEQEIDFAMKVNSSENTESEPVVYDFPTSEKLRRLALIFYQANELDRATLLINRALETFSEIDKDASRQLHIMHDRDAGITGDRVLLKLDAACISAKQNNFDTANKFVDEALALPPLSSQAYGAKLAELSSIYVEQHRIDEAISILRKARSKGIPTAHRMSRNSSSSAYVVDYWLARLLYDVGKGSEARPIIESAIEQAEAPSELMGLRPRRASGIRHDNYSYAPSVLAGDCAFAEKDFAAASLRYEQAGMSRRFDSLPISEVPQLSQLWLQKALECANRSANFPKDQFAQLYTELASSYERTNRQKSFEFSQKAVELLPDTDKQKSNLLARMANLHQQIKYETVSSNPILNPGANDPQQMDLLRRSAELAVKSGDSSACNKYLRLSEAEAAADQLDQAVKDCNQALRLFNGNYQYMTWSSHVLLGSRIGLINLLARKGRIPVCITLLETAAARVASVMGPDSDESVEQLLQLMQFYIDRNDTTKALLVLDRALSCRMKPSSVNEIYVSHSYHGASWQAVYSWAKSTATSDPALSMAVLNKLLSAQKRKLPTDDLKLGSTYLALADLNRMKNDDNAALANYQSAFNIYKLYFGENGAANHIPREYFSLLRKAGRTQETERLESLMMTRINPLQQRLQGSDVDLASLKQQYDKAKSDAPYSALTVNLLDKLCNAAAVQKNWSIAEDALLQRLALGEHFHEEPKVSGRFVERLAKVYIDSGSLQNASKWLQKDEFISGTPASLQKRYFSQLINAYLQAGQKESASKLIGTLAKTKRLDESTIKELELRLSGEAKPIPGGVSLNANGARNANGGNLRINADTDPLWQSPTPWTFRVLECRAIVFPSFFVMHSGNETKEVKANPRLSSSKVKNSDATNQTPELWYAHFTEELVTDFIPTVRGAIGANIRIRPGGIASITYYGYKYQIPLTHPASKPAPPQHEPPNNENKLKDSILRALKRALKEPGMSFPADTDSIDVKILFGGDPNSEGGCWESLGLIDDLNGEIVVQEK